MTDNTSSSGKSPDGDPSQENDTASPPAGTNDDQAEPAKADEHAAPEASVADPAAAKAVNPPGQVPARSSDAPTLRTGETPVSGPATPAAADAAPAAEPASVTATKDSPPAPDTTPVSPEVAVPATPSNQASGSDTAAVTPVSPGGDQASADQPAAPATPATEATAASTTEAGQPATDAGQAPAASEAAGQSADASPEGKKKKKRRRKKKKKPGDAAEAGAPKSTKGKDHHHHHRPTPFHVGEDVFGKVTAVLDTAIMVDLSGKALGIFDRGEMEADDLVPEVGDRFLASVHNDGARGGLVVLTRKPLREEEAKPKVAEAAKEGAHVFGLITGVIKGGVEVDIDGLRAFAPASGMDLHPQQANFTALLGQRMEFKVVQYENAGRDVVVTRRPMLEQEAHERRVKALELLEEGQEMNGVVRTVVEWGVFVALPDAANLEGLVHVSEASHDPRAKLIEMFKPGDSIAVKIIKIDEKGKIWLSHKAMVEDPWATAKEKYPSGSRHKGKVQKVERFGAFVELEEGVDGLIHVSDLAFDRVEDPQEIVKPGDEIEVVVHHFDYRNKKLALHPAPPPERADEPKQKVQKGSLIKVEVVKPEGPGLVVRVLGATGRAARGFMPAGQTGTPRGTDLRKKFRPGTQLDVKVIDVDPRRGEPKVSIRAAKEDEERRAHKEYRKKLKEESSFGTLGDLLKAKLGIGPSGDQS